MSPSQPSQRQALERMLGLQTMGEPSGAQPPPDAGDGPDMYDPATGLPDRRWLRRAFGRAAMRALRTGEPLSFALLRLDNPRVLCRIGGPDLLHRAVVTAARRLRPTFRSTDVFVRWGDDQFAVLFPATTTGGGVRAIEKAMWAIQSEPLLTPEQEPFEIGFRAAVVPVEPAAPFTDAVHDAEQLLAGGSEHCSSPIRWPQGELAPLARRVLLISTDPQCLELTRELASQPEDELVRVAGLDEAPAQLESMLPKLVVLDLADRAEPGFELLRRMRQTSAASGIPIVIVGDDPAQLPRAFALGADDFLLGPLRPEEFRARTERLLTRRVRAAPDRLPAGATGREQG